VESREKLAGLLTCLDPEVADRSPEYVGFVEGSGSENRNHDGEKGERVMLAKRATVDEARE
jgi:hypothetical protein